MQRSYFFCWPYHVDIWQLHLTIDTYNSTFRFHVDSITVVSRWWIKRFSVFLGGGFCFCFCWVFFFFCGWGGGGVDWNSIFVHLTKHIKSRVFFYITYTYGSVIATTFHVYALKATGAWNWGGNWFWLKVLWTLVTDINKFVCETWSMYQQRFTIKGPREFESRNT